MKIAFPSTPYILVEQPAHGEKHFDVVVGVDNVLLSRQAADAAARRLQAGAASSLVRPGASQPHGVRARLGLGLMTTGFGLSGLGFYIVRSAVTGARNPFEDSATLPRNPMGMTELAGIGLAIAGMAVSSTGTIMIMPTDRSSDDRLPVTDPRR